MNIAFSTEWFLTIPGILITCGVILLIIALIMFIVSSMKGKKDKSKPVVSNNAVEQNSVPVSPTVESNPVQANVPVNNIGVQPQVNQPVNTGSVQSIPTAVEEPVKTNSFINNDISENETAPAVTNVASERPSIDIPTIQPVNTSFQQPVMEQPTINSTVNEVEVAPVIPNIVSEQPSVDIPSVQPANTTYEQPVVDITPTINPTINPVMENNTTDIPNVDLSQPTPSVPVINPVVEDVIPTSNVGQVAPSINEPVVEMPEIPNMEQANTNIYGGAIPTVDAINVQPEVSRPIYGGADPLEATQNLPKIDVHHEPYSGGIGPVVDIQPMEETVTTPVNTTPVMEVVPPVVEQTVTEAIPIPSVVEIPDVEQL